MIYLVNKRISREKERGVTILLSILLLAAISSIVFSFAAIALNEIRSSGDLLKSEPAIKAAEGASEELLWQTLRYSTSVTSCLEPDARVLDNKVSVKSCADYYLPSPYTFSLNPAQQIDFYIFNPINQRESPGYTNLKVSLNTGTLVRIYFCEIIVETCTSTTPNNLSPLVTSWSTPLDPTKGYTLIIVNGASGITNITLDSAQDGVAVGLPAGTTSIRTTGSNQGVTRKLQTNVPQ